MSSVAKKPKPEGKKYSYMDTYGDLVTLLMCFFVLLFAMSTVEETKYNAFVEALSNHFGPAPMNLSSVVVPDSSTTNEDFGDQQPTGDLAMEPDQTLPAEFQQLSEAIEKYVEENDMQGEVSVEVGENGTTFIRLSDNLLFGGDSSVLRSEALDFLDFLGECFHAVENDIFRVYFNGHTANITGSGTDDWVLSGERSGRVSSYFERTLLFPPGKMEGREFGRHYPIADNSTAEGVAKNRRVDIIVVGNDSRTLAGALVEASAVYFPDDDTAFFEGDEADLPGRALADIPVGIDTQGLTDEQVGALQEAVASAAASNGAAGDE